MKLKILSWNIWFDGYFDEISKFLQEADADIVALQEVVPDDPNLDVIGFMKKLGYEHVFAPVLIIEKDGRTMANAIFSKYKIINTEVFDLSEVDKRNAIRADIEVGGKVLHVFTTHLLHTHQKESEVQSLQAKNLIKLLPQDNVIVMGDFNSTPESKVITMMKEVLIDAEPSSQPTWCVYPAPCCNLNEVIICLDYIFTSNDIKTEGFKVGYSKGSDHLPVSVIIEI